jgi:hypothetical protein
VADSSNSGLKKVVKHPASWPWLAVTAEIPTSLVAHEIWGDSPAAASVMTLAAAGLPAVTWLAAKGTNAFRRVLATVSAGAGSGYLLIATVTDPADPVLLSALGIGGPLIAGSWNVAQVLRKNKDGKDGGKAETGVLVKAIGEARAKLRKKPTVEPNKVTAPIQLSGGDITADELGNRIKNIAGELGVSPTSVRVLQDPDNASRVDLVIVPQDMLRQPTPWPGPSSMGGSITEPVVAGPYEDGAPAEMWFPADEDAGRNATHVLVAGMNGSGKSAGMSVVMTDVLTRRDVIVWAVDPSKGMQTFAPFLPYLDWCEMTLSGGEAMIEALSRVITARADALGKAGFKNWTPKAFSQLGMPYMVVWIEEAAKFFREGTEMEGLVMEARSAGISVVVSLQRPSSTSMPTDVREQLGGVLCFGVKGSTTADMALPDDVRDGGARPEAWENRRPGYAYLVAPGVDEDRYTTPLRTYMADDDALGAALAIAPRPPADPITAAAAGEAYADRTRYTPADLTAAHALGAALEDAGVDPDTIPESLEASMRAREQQEEAAREAALEREVTRSVTDLAGTYDDDGQALDVDPDREIPPVPPGAVWSFGGQPAAPARQRKLTQNEADAELLALLEGFREEGRDILGPRDFYSHCGAAGRLTRSRSWLSDRLSDLAEQGVHLAETDEVGVYRLLYPETADA